MTDLLTSPLYNRPPIIEAVIQIRVSADADQRAFEAIAHKLKREYPHQQPLQNFQVTIGNTGANVAVSQEAHGIRVASLDQTDILLIEKRGITAARLPIYTGWETLRDNTRSAWQIWKAETPRHPIERVGVRYINRIDIPFAAPAIILGQYLTIAPNAAPVTQSPMTTFTTQIAFPTINPLWTATITTTTLGQTVLPNFHSLVLDIDIARTAKIMINDADLWSMIDEARGLKNDLFERCITDDARKLFS